MAREIALRHFLPHARAADLEEPRIEDGGVVTAPGMKQALAAFHEYFKDLEGPFETAEQLTEQCYNCHDESMEAFMESTHFTWQGSSRVAAAADGEGCDVESEDSGGQKKLAKRGEELKEEMDSLIDEIDEVLEENAEEFVKNYVQRGGE